MSGRQCLMASAAVKMSVAAVSVVAALAVATGCGGTAAVSQSEVQQRTWQYVKDQVGADVSVDDFGCIRDGDESHWKCLSTVRRVGIAPQQVAVSVTCDGDQCLFEAG